MCKVFAMSNMKKVKITKKFLNAVKAEVCRTGDKHGFGYAVLSDDGKLSGERTMRPLTFQPLQVNPNSTRTGSLPIVLKTRNQFGELKFDNAKSFIGHGRYSTNDVTLENTHPFVNDKIAMIHNGVVSDDDGVIDEKLLKTTNDTEIILRCWEKGGMPMVEKTVSGYYALAVLDKDGLLHIVRDDRAMLYIAYSRTVDSFMFATTPEIIKTVAKKMQWHIEPIEELLENIHVTLDRNDILSQVDITPKAGSAWLSGKASAAFGDGDSRASSASSSYEGYKGAGIYDASKSESHAYRSNVEVEDDEPEYREGVRERMARDTDNEETPVFQSTTFGEAVATGEAERSIIDDGCPNEGYSYRDNSNSVDESPDGYGGNGIDSPYDESWKKIS